MRPRNLPAVEDRDTTIPPRSSILDPRSSIPRGWWCLLGCLLALCVGCGSRAPRSADHVEVTGQVQFDGKPLLGGQVTFVTVIGGFVSTGTIDEHGKYKIDAPAGEVRIGVDNRMLSKQGQDPRTDPTGKKAGAGRPDQGEPDPIKGTYVQIPDKYYSPETSGLSYTVTNGKQTHDIALKK